MRFQTKQAQPMNRPAMRDASLVQWFHGRSTAGLTTAVTVTAVTEQFVLIVKISPPMLECVNAHSHVT
eukprot:5414090-Amphidinium_carterae.4